MIADNARRFAVGLLAGLVALTAIGGGIAQLVGAEAERFPIAWLRGTPFTDYTIPALLLTFGVGGSALTACILALRGHPLARVAALLAGLILMGYIIGELLLLEQEPPGPTGTEILYFVLGVLIIALAWGKARPAQPPADEQS